MDKLDILNRKEFVENVVRIIDTTAKNKGHRCFAIDGEWGAGKTWVLDEIEKEISKKEGTPFLVINYNSWEYDYYEEPLIAIVSALLKFVESTKIIPPRTKGAIKKGLNKIGEKLLSIGSAFAKPYVGFDIKETIDKIQDSMNDLSQEERLKFNFDKFYDFKGILLELKNELSKLSKKYTIVFCVDELDRCLPEYAIKVLEQLHHVFDGIENLQVILSIDRAQLEQTVKTIFGEKVNVSGYLTKFIDFTISLPLGDLDQEKFEELFADYVGNFNCKAGFFKDEIKDFLREIFSYTNVRRQIKIIEKAKLVHSLAAVDKGSYNADHLATEIVLTIASFIYGDLNKRFKEIHYIGDVIDLNAENEKELWIIKEKVFNETSSDGYLRYVPPKGDRESHILNCEDPWGFLYVMLLDRYSSCGFQYKIDSGPYNWTYIKLIRAYVKEFFDILKMIS